MKYLRQEIMDKFWVNYLRYWKTEIRDMERPPTKGDFWAWYAFRMLDEEHHPDADAELKKKMESDN